MHQVGVKNRDADDVWFWFMSANQRKTVESNRLYCKYANKFKVQEEKETLQLMHQVGVKN